MCNIIVIGTCTKVLYFNNDNYTSNGMHSLSKSVYSILNVSIVLLKFMLLQPY